MHQRLTERTVHVLTSRTLPPPLTRALLGYQWTRDPCGRHVLRPRNTDYIPSNVTTMRSLALAELSSRLTNGPRLFSLVLLPLLLLVASPANLATAVIPETIFEYLAKPFAPSDGASEQCLHDSGLYLREVDRYTPWALQSKSDLAFLIYPRTLSPETFTRPGLSLSPT